MHRPIKRHGLPLREGPFGQEWGPSPEWPNLSHGCWDCKDHVVSVPHSRRNVFSGRLRREDRWHPSRGGSGGAVSWWRPGTGPRPASRPSRASLPPPRARTSRATLRLAWHRPGARLHPQADHPRDDHDILAAARSVTRSDRSVGRAIGWRDRRSEDRPARRDSILRAIPGIGLSSPKTTAPLSQQAASSRCRRPGRSPLPVRAVEDIEGVDQARHRGTAPAPVVPQDRLGDPSPKIEPDHADHRGPLPRDPARSRASRPPPAARPGGGVERCGPPINYGAGTHEKSIAFKIIIYLLFNL